LRRPQNRRKSVASAAGEGGGGGGSGGGDARQAGGACAAVGDGAGAVGGTCRAHIGCCQRAAWGARGRLRADWAWKMGVGGRRRTEIDAEEVVLTLGCRPQTQTPLPEPWLHHNHGPGGPPDCCSYGRRPATYGRGGWRPLGSGMGNGADSRRWRVDGRVEGVLSTASDDSSTTNSPPARPMSHLLDDD
jgi:hypothetical protein